MAETATQQDRHPEPAEAEAQETFNLFEYCCHKLKNDGRVSIKLSQVGDSEEAAKQVLQLAAMQCGVGTEGLEITIGDGVAKAKVDA